jgi:hypothetical protein
VLSSRTSVLVRTAGTSRNGIRLDSLLLFSLLALVHDVGARWTDQRRIYGSGGRREGLCGTRGGHIEGALACKLATAFARVEKGNDYKLN